MKISQKNHKLIATTLEQGDTASSVSELPLLAVTSEKGGSYTGSVARIDNMLTYSGIADQPRKLLPTSEAAPTPAPTTCKGYNERSMKLQIQLH